jgi:hypothetical protein
MNDWELLQTEAYDDGVVTEVIRPAAIVPESAARRILVELAVRDVRTGGLWWSEPTTWRRYDGSWETGEDDSDAEVLGSLQIAYGVPTRYDITIYRVTITQAGQRKGYTVSSLCDEALAFGGLTLETCPRADLQTPPAPFRFAS